MPAVSNKMNPADHQFEQLINPEENEQQKRSVIFFKKVVPL